MKIWRDFNIGRPEFKDVTVTAWKRLMPEIIHRSLIVLDSSERLLDLGGNEAVCAGLYTFAVEEYGKLLLLRKYQPNGNKVTIKFDKEFLNHRAKFREAINNLPKECVYLSKGLFDPTIFDPKTFDTERLIANCETRLIIFYSDFKDAGDVIIDIPSIDKNMLKKAIAVLKEIFANTTYPK